MTDRHSFAYGECSISEGQSLAEWRRARETPRKRGLRRFWRWFA